MSYFEFTLGILTGIRTMVSETRKEYPITTGVSLAVVMLTSMAVVIDGVQDSWTKALLWQVLCVAALFSVARGACAGLRYWKGKSPKLCAVVSALAIGFLAFYLTTWVVRVSANVPNCGEIAVFASKGEEN